MHVIISSHVSCLTGFDKCLIHSVQLGICVNYHKNGIWIEKVLSFYQEFQSILLSRFVILVFNKKDMAL